MQNSNPVVILSLETPNLMVFIFSIPFHLFPSPPSSGETPMKTLRETAKEATEKAKETALAATEKAKNLASKAGPQKKTQYV